MSQVVVYDPAERAETFSMFPFSLSLLCGLEFWKSIRTEPVFVNHLKVVTDEK
jgi:hypothetical protein